METLKLRAHHGMCIANFVGKGYDEAFTENMKAVVARLSADPSQEIEVVHYEDVLCAYCPNRADIKGREADGSASACDGAEKRDRKTIKICGLNIGSKLTWEAYSKLIKEKVFESHEFENLCRSCEWYELCTEVSFKAE